MKKNIFFWGAKYKAGIIYNLINKNNELFNDVIEVYETSTINQNLAR